MEDYDIMTREEAEKKMEVLRQIFSIVRLVRGHAVLDLDGKTGWNHHEMQLIHLSISTKMLQHFCVFGQSRLLAPLSY